MACYFTFTFCLSKAEKLVWRACGRAPICQKQGGNGDGEPCCPQPFCKRTPLSHFLPSCWTWTVVKFVWWMMMQWRWSFLRNNEIPMHCNFSGNTLPSVLTQLFGLDHYWRCFLTLWYFTIFGWFSWFSKVFFYQWCSTNRADVFKVHWPSYAIISNLLSTIGPTMRCIDQAYISLFVRFWHVKGDLLAETLSPPIRLRASLSSYICDNFLVLPFPKVQHLLPPDPNRRSTNPISGSQVQFLQPAPCSNHWRLKTGIDGLRRNNCPSPLRTSNSKYLDIVHTLQIFAALHYPQNGNCTMQMQFCQVCWPKKAICCTQERGTLCQ